MAIPSPAQNALYDAMSQFLKNTVSGWVSAAFKVVGPAKIEDFLENMVTLGAVDYFNRVAHWVDNREDDYVNEHFDKMLSINVGRRYHHYDLIQILFAMSLRIVKSLKVNELKVNTYEECMQRAKDQIHTILEDIRTMTAINLQGCACGHGHEPLRPDEDLFQIKTKPRDLCHVCDKQTSTLCAGCKSIRYCSDLCQKQDWKRHKAECKKLRK
jgi:hypothetical protein